MQPTIKPGWKTTEFWVSTLTTVGMLLGTLVGVVPPQYTAIAAAFSAGAYAISRGLTKAGAATAEVKP